MTEYVFACPECGKKVLLHLQLSKAVKPAPQRTLPLEPDLDEDLAEYNELLHITNLEGALCYHPKGGKFIERDTWMAIDEIMRRHGGKWIPGAGEERHWEVPTP